MEIKNILLYILLVLIILSVVFSFSFFLLKNNINNKNNIIDEDKIVIKKDNKVVLNDENSFNNISNVTSNPFLRKTNISYVVGNVKSIESNKIIIFYKKFNLLRNNNSKEIIKNIVFDSKTKFLQKLPKNGNGLLGNYKLVNITLNKIKKNSTISVKYNVNDNKNQSNTIYALEIILEK